MAPTALAIPDSRLLILDKTGHVAMMERPQAVARAMAAMFDEAENLDASDSALSVL